MLLNWLRATSGCGYYDVCVFECGFGAGVFVVVLIWFMVDLLLFGLDCLVVVGWFCDLIVLITGSFCWFSILNVWCYVWYVYLDVSWCFVAC